MKFFEILNKTMQKYHIMLHDSQIESVSESGTDLLLNFSKVFLYHLTSDGDVDTSKKVEKHKATIKVHQAVVNGAFPDFEEDDSYISIGEYSGATKKAMFEIPVQIRQPVVLDLWFVGGEHVVIHGEGIEVSINKT